MNLDLRQLELGPMANFVYLIADPETKDCAVVDPAWDVAEILRVFRPKVAASTDRSCRPVGRKLPS